MTPLKPTVKRHPINAVVQHYRLTKLIAKSGKLADFSGAVVVMLPTSIRAALFYLQSEKGLLYPLSPDMLKGFGEAKEVQYTITAWNDDTCLQEDFRHPVEHKLLIGDSGMSRTVGPVPLFTHVALNDVLGTKKFPFAKAVQFIC